MRGSVLRSRRRHRFPDTPFPRIGADYRRVTRGCKGRPTPTRIAQRPHAGGQVQKAGHSYSASCTGRRNCDEGRRYRHWGGIVGSAIAFGLAQRHQRVIVLDGDDRDNRAARANFGLIWVHGKGTNMPEYQLWSRLSGERWDEFSRGPSGYYRAGSALRAEGWAGLLPR
ncbi:FAD-dependent oxidoreductase [Mesorhizobium sp. M0910]|uniref:FAD-dependent oxidoreductase n=1 Tax=Mesorhizobium sp. M0910 TaxID=2957025 RepID=UPI00333DEEBE